MPSLPRRLSLSSAAGAASAVVLRRRCPREALMSTAANSSAVSGGKEGTSKTSVRSLVERRCWKKLLSLLELDGDRLREAATFDDDDESASRGRARSRGRELCDVGAGTEHTVDASRAAGNVLHLAVRLGAPHSVLRGLCLACPSLVCGLDTEGRSPLHLACCSVLNDSQPRGEEDVRDDEDKPKQRRRRLSLASGSGSNPARVGRVSGRTRPRHPRCRRHLDPATIRILCDAHPPSLLVEDKHFIAPVDLVVANRDNMLAEMRDPSRRRRSATEPYRGPGGDVRPRTQKHADTETAVDLVLRRTERQWRRRANEGRRERRVAAEAEGGVSGVLPAAELRRRAEDAGERTERHLRRQWMVRRSPPAVSALEAYRSRESGISGGSGQDEPRVRVGLRATIGGQDDSMFVREDALRLFLGNDWYDDEYGEERTVVESDTDDEDIEEMYSYNDKEYVDSDVCRDEHSEQDEKEQEEEWGDSFESVTARHDDGVPLIITFVPERSTAKR